MAEPRDELPHGSPFRFVGRILTFHPREGLEASFDASDLAPQFHGFPWIPESCILEGMAQASIIWFVRTVAPLQPWETPLLGYLSFDLLRRVAWDEIVRLRVRPLLTLSDRGVFEACADAAQSRIAQGQLAVARTGAPP